MNSIERVQDWYRNHLTGYSADPNAELKGVGGWLLFFVFATLLGAARSIYSWVVDDLPILTGSQYYLLTTPGCAEYHPLWEPFLLGTSALSAVRLTLSAFVLVAIFKSWRHTTKLVIGTFAFSVLCFALHRVALEYLPIDGPAAAQVRWDATKSLIFMTMFGALWSMYFLGSARVRATFVR